MDPSSHQPTLQSFESFEPHQTGAPAQGPPPASDGRWHPERLLALADPQRPATTPPALFAGEEKFLSRRKIAKRQSLQEQAWEAFARVREDGEELLYLAPAYQIPPFLHLLGLGAWWVYFHHVALFVTDRRLVEVELGLRGRGLGTRVRSLPLGELGRLRLRGRTLEARGSKWRRYRWTIRLRGDRRLLKQLVPKLAEGRVGATPAETPVVSHCPSCGHGERRLGLRCRGCGTSFRSRRLAAGLALAFPGAGLFFAGHPLLALFDLGGELLLYALGCLMVLQASDTVELAASLAVLGFFLLMTKLESVHLATVLVDRTKPIGARRASAWRTFGLVGAALSAVAVGVPLLFAGELAPTVERDLELAVGGEWEVQRTAAEWLGDEQDKRAEWHGPRGEVVEVRAYPLSSLETFDDFTLGFGSELTAALEPFESGSLAGVRAVERIDFGDDPFDRLIYALYDPEGHDVHVVTLDSEIGAAIEAQREVEDLLLRGRWVEAGGPVLADAEL